MIQLYHVSKNYEGNTRALVDISFAVERGEFVFLTGPSGAGKSTLLKLLFCSERQSDGQIVIDGKNTARFGAREVAWLRRKIGFIFQDFKLLNNKTVFENVALPLDIAGNPYRDTRKRVEDVLAYLGIKHRANYKPLAISGGEQQRVAIARALVKEPHILLADEPTGNLDPTLTEGITELFLDINAKGATVLVATHDINLIERFNKRTIKLYNGKILE